MAGAHNQMSVNMDSYAGTYKPVANTYSWVNLTNMVWVEQPVGTGFSQGTATATNEDEVASQFLGFFKNFVDTFAMEGFTVYITGESVRTPQNLHCPSMSHFGNSSLL